MVLETERLWLREMVHSDFYDLCKILQDKDVMYAYNHAFRNEEVSQWLDKQLLSYKKEGFGLWSVILKENNMMIGQCGLTMQPYGDKEVLEIGYLFQKSYWHNGYALEAAKACKKYAFLTCNAPAVYSIIRDTNRASQMVAIRNGMQPCGKIVKRYYNTDMPHIVYVVHKGDASPAGEY